MRLDPRRVQDLRTIRADGDPPRGTSALIAWGAFQIIARLAFGFLGAKKLDQAWSCLGGHRLRARHLPRPGGLGHWDPAGILQSSH